MEGSTELVISSSFYTLLIILLTGIISGEISKKIKAPDVVLFLLSGILIGPQVLNLIDLPGNSDVNQLILVFGASFILYAGGIEIDINTLREVKTTVLSLATLGVVISMAIVSSFSHFVFGIEWLTSLLIGAVIASTDPASLIPVFQTMSIPEKLKQTIISESAFNDAMGAVLVFGILSVIVSGEFSIAGSTLDFIGMIGFGLLVGITVGLISALLTSTKKYGLFTDYADIVPIVTSVLTYLLAEKIGGSGYMACFIAGMVTGNALKLGIRVPRKEYILQSSFRESLVTLSKIAIFILLGSHVDFGILLDNLVISIVLALVLVLISRPVSVFISTALDRKSGWCRKEKLFMSWVRETGVIPAALSSIITAQKIPGYQVISSVVFMTILITLTVQGTTTKYVAKKLNI